MFARIQRLLFVATFIVSIGYSKFSWADASHLKKIDCDVNTANFLAGEGVGCDSVKAFTNLYNHVKEIAPLSNQLSQVIIEKRENGIEMAENNKLFLLEKNRSEKYRNWTWIHEIGHLVFNNLIKKDFPEINCAYDEDINEQQSKSCLEVRSFLRSYNELFADFILVVTTSDIAATSAGNWTPPHNLKFDNANAKTCETNEFFGHYDYSISRFAIGKKFVEGTTTLDQKRKAILDFYHFLLADLQSNWQSSKIRPDCYIANERLLKRLNEL